MIAKHNAILATLVAITAPHLAWAQAATPAAPPTQQTPAATAAAPGAATPNAPATAPGAPAAPAAGARGNAGVPAATAPAAPPRAGAVPAPAGARAATAGANAPTTPNDTGDQTTVLAREAPKARSTVLEAFAPVPNGLTARDVARRAVASSHTIEAKNAELRSAAAKVDSSMYQFLPKLSLKAGYTRLSRVKVSLGSGGYSLGGLGRGPYTIGTFTDRTGASHTGLIDETGNGVEGGKIDFPVIVDNYSLGASLSVPLSDYVLRMSDSIKGTKENQAASELNIKAERAKVEGDARVAFFNWARAIGQVAVTEKSIERVRARLTDVQASFTVGMVTKAEVLRLQSLVASTEAGLESARAFRELASQQLAVIMNDQEPNYALGEDVLGLPTARELVPLNQLVAEAQKQRYELQSLEKLATSLGYAESVVRAGQLPRVDGFANYDYANPNQRYFFTKGWKGTWAVGAQATWVINDVLTSRASADDYSAQRDAVIANRRALADGIRLEVTSAYTDAKRAEAELEAARRAMEASQAAYDTAIQLFKVGKATTAELIDSESELVITQLRLINAHIDIKVAETKLNRALGRDLNKIGS
ncbi:MAG TPA: TolC family protein [Polyangiaceae bacterium]